MKPERETKQQSAFEAFVAAILKVPKDAITEAEGRRLKRTRKKTSER